MGARDIRRLTGSTTCLSAYELYETLKGALSSARYDVQVYELPVQA